MSHKKNRNQALLIILFMIFITFVVATIIVPNASVNISASGRATDPSAAPATGQSVMPIGTVVIWALPLVAIIAVMSFFVVKNIEKMHTENMG
jgi:heme/copper-type cytochrome/quinol oxidase subunit 2